MVGYVRPIVTLRRDLFEELHRLKESLGVSWSQLIELLTRQSPLVRLRRKRSYRIEGVSTAYWYSYSYRKPVRVYLNKVPSPVPCNPCITLRASYRGYKVVAAVARSGDSLVLYDVVFVMTEPPDTDVLSEMLCTCLQRAARLCNLMGEFDVLLTERTRAVLPLVLRCTRRVSTYPACTGCAQTAENPPADDLSRDKNPVSPPQHGGCGV